MIETVLAHGTIHDLMQQIEAIQQPELEDGHYFLYAPAGIVTLREDMEAAIILESWWRDEDDPLPEFALEHGLEPAYEIRMAQRVIAAAKRQKPEVTVSELISALNYFMDYDAFLNFDT